jgi:putative membrane protein insertion efficiency factor
MKPEDLVNAPRDGLVLMVRGYRLLLKPWLGNACRFEPTCSAYTLQALQQHGAWRGLVLGGWRVLRCHPWCNGGHDPVPAHFLASDANTSSASPASPRTPP